MKSSKPLKLKRDETARVSFVRTIFETEPGDSLLPGFRPVKNSEDFGGLWWTVVVVWEKTDKTFKPCVRPLVIDNPAYQKLKSIQEPFSMLDHDFKIVGKGGDGRPGNDSMFWGFVPFKGSFLKHYRDSEFCQDAFDQILREADEVFSEASSIFSFQKEKTTSRSEPFKVGPRRAFLPQWAKPLVGPQPVTYPSAQIFMQALETKKEEVLAQEEKHLGFLETLRKEFPRWDWVDRSLNLYTSARELSFLARGVQGPLVLSVQGVAYKHHDILWTLTLARSTNPEVAAFWVEVAGGELPGVLDKFLDEIQDLLQITQEMS